REGREGIQHRSHDCSARESGTSGAFGLRHARTGKKINFAEQAETQTGPSETAKSKIFGEHKETQAGRRKIRPRCSLNCWVASRSSLSAVTVWRSPSLVM